MWFCYGGFTRQVFTLMFWGYVRSLTKTQASPYTHVQTALQSRLSLIITPMFTVSPPTNSMQEHNQTPSDPNAMILILLRHLYEELIP